MDFVKKQFVSGSKTRNAQAPLHPKAYLTRIRDRPFLRWSRICWNGNLLKAFPLRRNKLSKILLTQSSVVRDGKSLVNGSCNFTRLVAASDTVRSFFLAIFPTNLSSFPLDNCSDQGIFLFHGKASRCSKESARGNRSSCLVQTSPRLQRPQLRKDALYWSHISWSFKAGSTAPLMCTSRYDGRWSLQRLFYSWRWAAITQKQSSQFLYED